MQYFKRDSEKGSLIVEAAIFIPLFILAILTIAFTMKVFATYEYNQHRLSEEMSFIAAKAYTVNHSTRIYGMGESLTIRSYRYLFSEKENEKQQENSIPSNDLIEVVASFSVANPFALRMIPDYNFIQRITLRAWTGHEKEANPATFQEMMEDSDHVYIFPKFGTKYHKSDCRLIANSPVQEFLSHSHWKSFEPCRLCNAANLSIGSYIYLFNDKIFHSRECFLVDKKIEVISLEDALDRGYNPCQICYGIRSIER